MKRLLLIGQSYQAMFSLITETMTSKTNKNEIYGKEFVKLDLQFAIRKQLLTD